VTLACQTQPKGIGVAALGHFPGRWIVGVPLFGQPGMERHRLALTEAATHAVTGGTAQEASSSFHVMCQVSPASLPLMFPATAVFAAGAAQPDVLCC
jgi:hypothetical protein